MTGEAGGSTMAEDSHSEPEDTTRRPEMTKNEPSSSPGIISLIPADLALRRPPNSAVLASPDDHSDLSSESATSGRVASPSQDRQPYNMASYYGGVSPASQLLQQQRQHHQQQLLLLQRQHHQIQSTHHHLHRDDNRTTYPHAATDGESPMSAMETELYEREAGQYYSSPVMQYYSQNNSSTNTIKCLDNMDRM